jgi:hypothetical protein
VASAFSVAADRDQDLGRKITKVLVDFVSEVPATSEPRNASPRARARVIANAAALRGGAISGALALPSGPLGLLTIVPDLAAVWRIQAQMVADIAGAFGKSATLSREQILFCLFRHAAAQALRDLVVRVGGRYLVRRASLRALQVAAARIGVHVSQRAVAGSVARWLPVLGTLGVAGYAYYDTAQVAATAIAFFEQNEAA